MLFSLLPPLEKNLWLQKHKRLCLWKTAEWELPFYVTITLNWVQCYLATNTWLFYPSSIPLIPAAGPVCSLLKLCVPSLFFFFFSFIACLFLFCYIKISACLLGNPSHVEECNQNILEEGGEPCSTCSLSCLRENGCDPPVNLWFVYSSRGH